MEQKNQIEEEFLQEEQLSETEKTDAIKNELATIPEADKKSIMKVITENDLVKIGTHKKRLTSLKRKYGNGKIKFTHAEDKDMIKLAEDAARDLRKFRIAIDDERKELVAPMNNGVKFVNGKYSPIIDDTKDIEAPIKSIREEFKNAIEAKEKESELLKAQRVNDRVEALLNAGIFFDSEHYTIGSEEFDVPYISLGIVDLETLTDPIFENVLAQVKEKAETIAAATKEKEERLQKEKEEREAAEAEERRVFAEQQQKLLDEQEAMRKEREEMQKMREEMEAQRKQMEEQKQKEEARLKFEENARVEKLWRGRLEVLSEIGWSGQEAFDPSDNEKTIFTYEELITLSDDDFNVRAEAYNKIVSERNEAARLKKEADDKAKAEADEIERKKEEERIAIKAIEDKMLKDAADEAARKEELVKQGDQAVWTDYVKNLQSVEVPTFQSEAFQLKAKAITEWLNKQS